MRSEGDRLSPPRAIKHAIAILHGLARGADKLQIVFLVFRLAFTEEKANGVRKPVILHRVFQGVDVSLINPHGRAVECIDRGEGRAGNQL
jgi:hypothetical protein